MNYRSCFLSLLLSQVVCAMPASTIRAKYSAPITPRGGVLMVPLLAETPSNNWPSTLDVTLEDGTVIEGHIGWVENNTHFFRFWEASPLTIRPINTEDDTSKIDPKDTTTGPVLLAQLPNIKSERLKIGNDVIEPIWFAIPEELPNLNLSPIDASSKLPLSARFQHHSSNPLDYWRVTLIASKRGVQPPKPYFDTIDQLAASQGEQLWRIAFDRLAKSSRGAAAECRDLLTNTGHDGRAEFACWATATDSQLLSILLDPSATSRHLSSRALRWCAEQKPFVFWLESVYGNEIIVAVANPTLEPVLVAVKWKEGNDIPIVVKIPANETIRIPVQRIDQVDLSIFGPTTIESRLEWLELQIGSHLFSLPIVPPTVVAHPPSVQLQPLYPPWNLQSIQNQTPTLVQHQFRTVVELRKLFGKWEFFISCAGNSTQSHEDGESVVLYNPPLQNHLQVIPSDHFSTKTRWSARVPVPEEWIVDDLLQFSIQRKHGSATFNEFGPIPVVPWQEHYAAPIIVDLSEWDLITSFPDS
ncbi:MAG: hypothetical protein HOC27_05630 [Phycisphaerae bacterium]|nr:hypothetical protein [Phycisphaerae bacterium]